MSNYFHSLDIAIDQLANTLLAGYPDETLSSRSYRCKDKSKIHNAIADIGKLVDPVSHLPIKATATTVEEVQ